MFQVHNTLKMAAQVNGIVTFHMLGVASHRTVHELAVCVTDVQDIGWTTAGVLCTVLVTAPQGVVGAERLQPRSTSSILGWRAAVKHRDEIVWTRGDLMDIYNIMRSMNKRDSISFS